MRPRALALLVAIIFLGMLACTVFFKVGQKSKPTPPPFLKEEGVVLENEGLEIIWRSGSLQDRKCLLRVREENLPKDLLEDMIVWQPAGANFFVQSGMARLEGQLGPFELGEDVKVLETSTAKEFFSHILVAEVSGQHFLYVEW